jgi:curved DNA-binding protein CbpA
MQQTMDLYAELGVTPQAEPEVIRAAFRALARRYHPDRQSGASALTADKMARINHAYDVLGQADKRRAYDASRLVPRSPRLTPVLHITTASARGIATRPFLTTYDQRGRLHAFV